MGKPDSSQTAVLPSESLEVVVLPGKGVDIYAIVDRSTGIDVLFKSPWGLARPADPGALR
jgi:hypothetical protein